MCAWCACLRACCKLFAVQAMLQCHWPCFCLNPGVSTSKLLHTTMNYSTLWYPVCVSVLPVFFLSADYTSTPHLMHVFEYVLKYERVHVTNLWTQATCLAVSCLWFPLVRPGAVCVKLLDMKVKKNSINTTLRHSVRCSLTPWHHGNCV